MPRPALARLPIEVLQAELARRAAKANRQLKKLLKQRAKLDAQIAGLEALAGGALADRRGRRAKAVKAAPKGRRKRGTFSQTAEQFILDLVAGDGATTAEINKKWTAAGRGGRADTALNRLFKAKKVKREKIKGAKGSIYTAA